MNEGLIYHLSMALIGVYFALTGLFTLATAGLHISPVLSATGGTVLLIAIGFSYRQGEWSESGVGRWDWVAISGVLLVLLGAVLEFRL